MSFDTLSFFLIFFLLSFVMTMLVRAVAHKTGFVSKPKPGRWSEREVALGGGLAIHFCVGLAILWLDGQLLWGILPAFLALWCMGIVDDLMGIGPLPKLIVQTTAAAYVVSKGYLFPLDWKLVSIVLSVLWIITLSNAVNLIDNMDGFAAGVTLISFMVMAFLFREQTHLIHFKLCLAISGVLFGFLIHNFNPAKIFMGDAGSLPLGFLLAVMTTQVRHQSPDLSNSFSILSALLLVCTALFDMFLVMVARRNAKRPLMLGGRDHSSHRLVRMGFSERKAVLVLYLIQVICSVAAYQIVRSPAGLAFAIWGLLFVSLTFWAAFLLDVEVYPMEPQNRDPHELPNALKYIVEVGMDVCMVAVVWLFAHMLRFEGSSLVSYKILTVVPALPYIIILKISVYAYFRLYRGIWKGLELVDIYRMFKASLVSTVLFIAFSAFFTRLQDISRVVLVLDCLLTFIALLGTRSAWSGFRHWVDSTT